MNNNKIQFSLLALLLSVVVVSAQAQEAISLARAEPLDNAASLIQSSASEIKPIESTQISQMSTVEKSSESVELVVSSQAINATAGVCLVVSGLLADFCKSYPGDISCNFQ